MYNGIKVLDVHSHIHDWTQGRHGSYRLGRPFLNALTGSVGIGATRPIPSPIAPGKHSAAPGNKDEDFKAVAEAHAKYLDVRNIDTQVLSVHPLNLNGWLAPHLFRSWITYSNDMVFKLCQAQPTRFVGACQIPQVASEEDTRSCVKELERCVQELGFVAAYVSPDITGNRDTPGMGTSYWYPLYEKFQELGIPIIVHGSNGLDPRYRTMGEFEYYQLNFLTEQHTALVCLRTSDVFQRFPGLKVVICHCGGALERLIGENRSFLGNDKDLSNNLFFDTCAYDLDFLALAIKQRGISQMAYGTEAPGSGTMLRPGTEHTADDLVPMIGEDPTLGFLSERDKADIFYNTPAKLCQGLADAAATNAKTKSKAY